MTCNSTTNYCNPRKIPPDNTAKRAPERKTREAKKGQGP